MAPVAVAPLIASVLDSVQPEAQRADVTIERACADAALQVEGDAAQLRDVFLNLAQNAIQAMPRGGRLTVRCSALPDRRVQVRVEDTGVGIAPENLDAHLRALLHDEGARHRARFVDGVSHRFRFTTATSTWNPRSGWAPHLWLSCPAAATSQ